ncbi:distal membrane-arm assembly complex protein 1 isoform X2 [Gracilinanus agilis]|uniref:distal membrane-arm assembly complex protein 1 isoform X2 n=1 Tax=Gracilinanus agilis TaxID=191870 RepID=UPI001CFDF9B1|nr:distal membrane-arm assembly complex protein 1 isoform X2 [Gracilinanus agilis]
MAATTSSSPPATPASAPDTAPSKNQLMSGCLSCRLLSGVGLLGAGGYVYWTARRPMKLGYYPGPGTILQMVIGISIASWGIVILVDPVGKASPVGSKKQ